MTSAVDFPSQSTVAETQGSDSYHQQNDDACISVLRIVKDFKNSIRSLPRKADSTIGCVQTPWTLRPPFDSIRVIIIVNHGWSECKHLAMDGSGVTANNSTGGKVHSRDIYNKPGDEECYDNGIFELVLDPELGSQSVSFKSTCFENVYLRADYKLSLLKVIPPA